MSLLFPIITLAVSIIMPLLPIITIITYYYVFETGQLADGATPVTKQLEVSTAAQPGPPEPAFRSRPRAEGLGISPNQLCPQQTMATPSLSPLAAGGAAVQATRTLPNSVPFSSGPDYGR